MLYEFCIPRCVCLIAVAPVNDELGDQRASKFRVDMRHLQNIEHIFRWIPLLGDAFGFGVVLHRRGVFCPLYANVLNELGVEIFWVCAALAPVEYEFRDGLEDKIFVYVVALHNFQCIQTWAPVVIQYRGFLYGESLSLILLLTPPLCSDMLTKFIFPSVAGLAPFLPIKDEIFQLVQGELPRYGVVHR